MRVLRAGLLFLVVHSFAWALESSEAAFQTMKSLEGKWAILSGEETLQIEMVYGVGSKGSIVTEQFGKELSVFYRDHQSVMMIHFCNAGNQPRLKLSERSGEGLLEFDAVGVSNLVSPEAAHVQRVIYKMLDKTRMDLEIVWIRNGSEESEKYRLTRL